MRHIRIMALLIMLIVLFPLSAFAQKTNIQETNLLGWNGNTWQKVAKGNILHSKMVYMEDFLCYSNTTTGVAILAGASAPDNSNILTPVDWYWGTTLVGGGTVKIIAGVNGTAVIDTAHAAQNDAATLSWREALFDISNNPSIEARVKINSLTNCTFEGGWYVDGNDECLFRFNPAVSATKFLTVYENNNGGEQVYTTATTATTDTYVTLKIELFSTGAAKFWINGVLIKSYAASTIKDVAFKPRFYAKVADAGHAATKTLTIDYVRITQDR
ncbi:MAG: hypothetical protein ABFD54_05730 [Armatimonadota bacterium]|nr:hypothetical protein [bacterium]